MIRKGTAILLSLVGLLALAPEAVAEDPVYFADANLKAAVEIALGKSNPTPTDMLLLTSLTARQCGIAELTGIEYAMNLTHLDLSGNFGINNISALAGLTNLTHLDLSGVYMVASHPIYPMTALSGLTNLTYLMLYDNPLNIEAYCTYLPLIKDNNPGIDMFPDALDSYPPGGNGCNDGCECEGDFDGDQDQDGTDASTFKRDFGRSIFDRPCTNDDPCNGDLSCNGNVDGTDASLFKQDFGRSSLQNSCPRCATQPWCNYLVPTTTTTTIYQ